MKCKICKSKIEKTFLDKILGTYIRDKEGKRNVVCFACQKKYTSLEELKSKL